MQKIHISLIPTPEPESEELESMSARSSGGNAPESPVEFLLAARRNNRFVYEHKIALTTQGSLLQVFGKAPDGRITQALSEKAFSLVGQNLQLTLLDTFGDGTEYKIRVETGDMENKGNQVLLSGTFNPQLQIGEVCFEQSGTKIWELDFIGTDDYRYSSFPRVLRRPGEPLQLTFENGNIMINF